MAEHFAEAGMRVSVFSSMPSYFGSEQSVAASGTTKEGLVSVTRVSTMPGGSSIARVVGGIVFGGKLLLHTARPSRKYDIVVVQTVPPVIMGICGRIAAKLAGAKLVYHAMDIHPDAATASGDIGGSLPLRVLRFLDSATMAAADAVVVLSEDMRRTAENRGIDASNVVVINNFNPVPVSTVAVALPAACADMQKPGPVRFVFAGNLGRFQNLDALIDGFCVAKNGNPNIELWFVGEGIRRPELELLATHESSIRFVDQQSPEAALSLLRHADYAVVSLASGMLGSCYPSKVMAYLEAGCPLIAIVDEDSELARMTVDESIGFSCAPGDSRAIAETLQRAAEAQPPATQAVAAVGEQRFGRSRQLDLWLDLFETLHQ